MSLSNTELGTSKNITASGNVKNVSGGMIGFYVCSTTAGTIQLYDDAATGTTLPLTGLITPVMGWNQLPVAFASGLNAVIGGALNVSIVIV